MLLKFQLGVHVFLPTLIRFLLKKGLIPSQLYYSRTEKPFLLFKATSV